MRWNWLQYVCDVEQMKTALGWVFCRGWRKKRNTTGLCRPGSTNDGRQRFMTGPSELFRSDTKTCFFFPSSPSCFSTLAHITWSRGVVRIKKEAVVNGRERERERRVRKKKEKKRGGDAQSDYHILEWRRHKDRRFDSKNALSTSRNFSKPRRSKEGRKKKGPRSHHHRSLSLSLFFFFSPSAVLRFDRQLL